MDYWRYNFGNDHIGVSCAPLDAFREDLLQVCAKHRMSITAHVDMEGIRDIYISAPACEDDDLEWLFEFATFSADLPQLEAARRAYNVTIDQKNEERRIREGLAPGLRAFLDSERKRAFGGDGSFPPQASAWEMINGG